MYTLLMVPLKGPLTPIFQRDPRCFDLLFRVLQLSRKGKLSGLAAFSYPLSFGQQYSARATGHRASIYPPPFSSGSSTCS